MNLRSILLLFCPLISKEECDSERGQSLSARSLCVPARPLFRRLIVLFTIVDILLSDAAYQRIIGICVSEKGRDRYKKLRYGQRRAPVVLQNIQANGTVAVDVAVVDASTKGHFRRLERVVLRKMNIEEEYAARVWRAIGSHYARNPVVQIIALGSCRAVGRRIQEMSASSFWMRFAAPFSPPPRAPRLFPPRFDVADAEDVVVAVDDDMLYILSRFSNIYIYMYINALFFFLFSATQQCQRLRKKVQDHQRQRNKCDGRPLSLSLYSSYHYARMYKWYMHIDVYIQCRECVLPYYLLRWHGIYHVMASP